MKYCKKCGMLLEDNMEICIGCGSDVTKKDTYTKYPEQMQEKIELEKKEAGKRNLAVLAIVLIFVVMLLLIGIFVAQTYINESGKSFFPKITADKSGDKNKENGDANENKPEKNREIKDELGAYYKIKTVEDEEGHKIMTAVFPEDLSNLDHSINLERESQIYPAIFSFVATNEDNTTQLTFTSPQHYQYIIMTEGEIGPVDIQEELDGRISFYDFSTVEDYLMEIIKQAYPSAKKIEEMDSIDPSAEVSKKLDDIIKSYEDGADKELAGLFGLPETTKFTHNNTYKSDKILNYRILTKEDHAVSCKFYVPVFCERYDYKDDESGLAGQLSDTYILSVTSFEAGSDELYDWYENAFELFVDNIKLTDEFFALNSGRLNKEFEDFLNSAPAVGKSFKNGEHVINSGEKVEQVFIAPEKELIFATPDADEYPGDDYIQLEVQ